MSLSASSGSTGGYATGADTTATGAANVVGPSKPTARTYVVRHGSTSYNSEDSSERIRGHLDIPLTDEGRDQARTMGKSLKDSGITMLFASDLSRAKETADLMSAEMGGVPVLPQSGFRPWKLGSQIEGKHIDEVLPQIENLVDNPDEQPEDGESFNQFQTRFMGAFNRVQSDYFGDTIGIVNHYRGIKLLDSIKPDGSVNTENFKAKDATISPGSYRCMDKKCNFVDEKSGDALIQIPSVLYRDVTFESKSVDKDSRSISLSVSSDQPYERSFGTEILDHSDGSIRLNRMNDGAPILFNHDPDAHIGTVVTTSTDGKSLRVTAKMGSSPLAQQKLQDIRDGILKKSSIGYVIHDMREESKGVFRAIDWEPYEASLVTVPADPSVGVGRSMKLVRAHKPVDRKRETKTMAEPIIETPPPKVDVVAERQKAVDEFKVRCKEIDDYVAAIKNPKWQAKAIQIARKHKDGKANFEEFRSEAVNAFDAEKDIDIPDTKIGMSRKERGQFSVVKMIRDIGVTGSPQGLEKKACETFREHLDKLGDNRSDHSGWSLPDDISEGRFDEDHDLDSRAVSDLRRELRDVNNLFRRNLAASTGTTGGYLIGVDLLTGSIIELLRNKALVMQLGPTLLGGLVNNVAIPRVMTGSTVYWLAEGASVTESDPSFGQLALTPHRLGVDTAYTKQLVNQASLSVEAFVRDDMARQAAVELDRVYLNGGLAAGEPLGILNVPGVQTITFGAAATWAKMVQFETDIEGANAILGPMTFLTTPSTKNKLKTNPKIGTVFPIFMWENSDAPMINGVMPGSINGYTAYATKNVPGNKVIFGVWSELIVANWAGVDIVVDPYSLKKQEQVEVTMHQWVDCGIRHPVAFEVSTDSGAQ